MIDKGYIMRGDSHSQKFVMQANLHLLELLQHVEFTYMTEPSDNPYGMMDNQTNANEYYQRRIDHARVRGICDYIRKAILSSSEVGGIALFPTTILLAAHWEDGALSVGKELEIQPIYQQISPLLVVDGQHRLYSLKTLYESVRYSLLDEDLQIKDYLESYVFNCTILINFDLWEQAKVFADVNFNQKKVSKSVYYSIFGMHVPADTDDVTHTSIYISHQLVRYMNTYTESPLYHCIKMLGTGQGYISQAFFADSLMNNFHPRGIWYLDPDRDVSKDNYYYMAAELMDFWKLVKNTFNQLWPSPEKKDNPSIIMKTTGVGALLWLMAYIHRVKLPIGLHEKLISNYDSVRDQYCQIVSSVLQKIQPESERLFSINGMYGGSGGKGQEGKLRKELERIVNSEVD